MDHSEHSVRERAYALWERDGCIPGRNEHYWTMAERELLAERAAAAQPAVEGETPVAAAVEAPVEAKSTETKPAKARAARTPKVPAAEAAAPARKAAKAPARTAAAVVAAKAGAPRRRQTATGIVSH